MLRWQRHIFTSVCDCMCRVRRSYVLWGHLASAPCEPNESTRQAVSWCSYAAVYIVARNWRMRGHMDDPCGAVEPCYYNSLAPTQTHPNHGMAPKLLAAYPYTTPPFQYHDHPCCFPAQFPCCSLDGHDQTLHHVAMQNSSAAQAAVWLTLPRLPRTRGPAPRHVPHSSTSLKTRRAMSNGRPARCVYEGLWAAHAMHVCVCVCMR